MGGLCVCSPSRSLKSLRFRLRLTQSDPYCLDDLVITCLKSFSAGRINVLASILAFGTIAAIVSGVISSALPNSVSGSLSSLIGLLAGAVAVLPEVIKYYGFVRVKISKLREYFKMLTATDNLCRESYSLAQELMSKLNTVREGRSYTFMDGKKILDELGDRYGMIIDLSLKKSLE